MHGLQLIGTDGTVTSMRAELGRGVALTEVKAVLAREFRNAWPEFIRPTGAQAENRVT